MLEKLHLTKMSISLILITIILVIGSIFFTLKIRENKPTPTVTTKASSQTYKKVIQLPQATLTPISAISPTVQPPTPTSVPVAQIAENGQGTFQTQSFIPSPTQVINLDSSPTLASSATPKKIAPTSYADSLPTAGTTNITLLIFFTAVTLVLFGFVL